MTISKSLRNSVISLCVVIFTSLLILSIYNIGRDCLACVECDECLARHYAYDFHFHNIDIVALFRSMLIPTVFVIIPWIVGVLRYRELKMSPGLRVVLLTNVLASVCILSFDFYTEIWKASNSVWLCNIEFGDGPSWWLAFQCLNVVSVIFCCITATLLYAMVIYKIAKKGK